MSPNNRSFSRLPFLLLLMLNCVGCEERSKLVAEIGDVRRQATELQPQFAIAQEELIRVNKACQALKNQPEARNTAIQNLEPQIKALTERKRALEEEVNRIREDLANYRKSNP